jgi:hypothetical protein
MGKICFWIAVLLVFDIACYSFAKKIDPEKQQWHWTVLLPTGGIAYLLAVKAKS